MGASDDRREDRDRRAGDGGVMRDFLSRIGGEVVGWNEPVGIIGAVIVAASVMAVIEHRIWIRRQRREREKRMRTWRRPA